MQMLYSFGKLPVAGYLEGEEAPARNAPRYELATAICRDCGLFQQAFDDAKEMLVIRVYSDYQPTYSMSEQVAEYIDVFLDKALQRSAAQQGDYALEVGSNDGQLLSRLKGRGLRTVGVEPAANLNVVARERGAEVIEGYFGVESARKYVEMYPAVKLLVARHTLEHAFDPLDFLRGVQIVLAPEGLAAIEVPYLRLQMMNGHFEGMSFQHVSVFTVASISRALSLAGLVPVDVAFVNMDGGSMVMYARKGGGRSSRLLEAALDLEDALDLGQASGYRPFFERVQLLRTRVRRYFDGLARRGLKTAAYGAGSKGQALLNMLGLDAEQMPFVIDDVPGNAGRYVPGTGIEVVGSTDLRVKCPDVILLTAPTHIEEILRKEAARLHAKTQFLATVPDFHYVVVTNQSRAAAIS